MARSIAKPTSRPGAKRRRVNVIQHIKSRIHDGTWPPGYQLPTERELADQFGIARNTVRKALAQLGEENVLRREVGRGTFVAESPVDGVSSPEALLARIHGASPIDVVELRLVLEPTFVAIGALRATSRHRTQVSHCLRESEKATGVLEFEHWDGAFHHAILAAAQNHLVIDLYEAINGVRRQPEWESVKRRTLDAERLAAYRKQHRRVFKAFMARDGEAAGAAVREHLLAVRDGLDPSRADALGGLLANTTTPRARGGKR